jgi:hypothetical protein
VPDQSIRDDIASEIALGVHTGLRKFADSPASGVAWHAIHDLADGEWESICGIVADGVLMRIGTRLLEERSATGKWMTGDGPLPTKAGR